MSNKQKMIVTVNDNFKHQPIDIVIGHYQDSDCGMPLEDINYASQVISPSGKTWFFHDHGGMAHWLEDKDFKNKVKIFVWAKDTKKWIDGKKAYYTTTENTPMKHGFGAYKYKKDGMITFMQMYERVLHNETLANPYYKSIHGRN